MRQSLLTGEEINGGLQVAGEILKDSGWPCNSGGVGKCSHPLRRAGGEITPQGKARPQVRRAS